MLPAARAGGTPAETPWATPAAQGMAQMAQGQYDAARGLLQHAAGLAAEALGEQDPEVWALRSRLGQASMRAGRLAEAATELGTVLARQRQAGAGAATLGPTLSNLGAVHNLLGRYRDAEALHLESLQLQLQHLGPEHLELTKVHNNLGALYRQMGRLPESEEHLKRSLQLRERALGERHPDVGSALVNLGNLYRDMGELERAEASHRRGLAVLEEQLGGQHPVVATALNNLALVMVDGGDLAQARELFTRSLALRRQALGPSHPEVAKSLGNLARTIANLGDEAAALPLLQQALQIQQQQFGRPHRDLAQTLRELADLLARQGERPQAHALYERSARMLDEAFDGNHPELALVLAGMARLAWQEGRAAAAAPLLARATEIEDRHLETMLGVGAETQRRAFAATLHTSTDFAVELALHGGGAPELARLAAQTVLRRKGRVLDAMSRSTQAWARHLDAADRPLLQALGDVRAQRAAWLASALPADEAAHRQRGRELRERQSALEARLSRVAAPFVVQQPEVGLAAVQAALPPGAALLEWVVYQPRLKTAAAPFMEGGLAQARPDPAARRYAAFVLQRGSDPAWIDLGPAREIDAVIAAARRALADPLNAGWRGPAQRLDALVFAPLRARTARGVHTLLLAPDGALNLLPFAVLHQRPPLAVQRHRLRYLASGRDLLRWALPDTAGPSAPPAAGPGVIVAAPDFDAPAASASTAPPAGAWRPFPDLPATRREAAEVQRLLAGSRVISGGDATVQALRALRHPGVLHIATHGYAAADSAPGPMTRTGHGEGQLAREAQQADAALLDTGLALAGANDPAGGHAGLLSALELAGLDLWGTRLVVLSACDSGLGLALPGEGVLGLRHALGLAGSRSQVMSLWKVDDEGTRRLMQGFYRALARGLGPAEALRSVQLRLMRRGAPHDHPFYWAGFIAAGADAPIPAHLLAPADGRR